MATLVDKPMSEAEAYVAQGAQEISERLRDLIRRHREARRRRAPSLVRAAAEHPAAAAAFIVGAVLAALLADRLIGRERHSLVGAADQNR